MIHGEKSAAEKSVTSEMCWSRSGVAHGISPRFDLPEPRMTNDSVGNSFMVDGLERSFFKYHYRSSCLIIGSEKAVNAAVAMSYMLNGEMENSSRHRHST